MISYTEWLDDKGFYIKDAWDEEKNTNGGTGKLKLFPKHRRILEFTLTPNEDGRFPYETVLFSDIKKTGKSVISASVGAWYAETAPAGTEIYVIANSEAQASSRAFKDMTFHFQQRQIQFGKKFCKLGEFRIDFPNGTFIQVLSNSFRSAAGSRHALTLWDELWGAKTEFDRRLWDEMVPIPTVPHSLRFISSYAGFENESELLWELFIRGIGPGEGSEHEHKGQGKKIPELDDLPCWTNGKMFTYWSHESDLPWYTEEYLEEQRQNERPAAFLRLFENQWVTSHEAFIPIEWWDKAAENYEGPADLWESHPMRYFPITIGIDAGIKRDTTAMVAVAYDSKRGKVGILFHKIWKPSPGDPVDIDSTVEAELRKIYNEHKFIISSIVYDPTHLLSTMARLSNEGLPCRTYDQTSSNMISASENLYGLLKNRKLEAYEDQDLRRHIQMSVAEQSARGFRIVKTKTSKRHHIDAAIALAMACHDAVMNGGVDISIPVTIESPFSDMTINVSKELELPFELRSPNDGF